MSKEIIKYNNKVIYTNSILSLAYKFIGALLSFISAPMLLNCLGTENYGVWVTLLSLISWIYYCDLGIGNGYRNKLAECLALEEYDKAKKITGIAYTLISAISLAIVLFVCIFCKLINLSDLLNISTNEENINLIFLVALIFACINFIFSLANNILYALQRASLVSLFGLIGQLLFIIALFVYNHLGIRLILYVAIAEGCTQIFKNIIETIYVFIKHREFRFGVKDIQIQNATGILSFGLQMFLIQIAALVLNSTDNIIISKFFGAASVTPYNFCFKYFNMIQTVYVALMAPLLSAYTVAFTKKDYLWIKRTLKKNIVLYIIFVSGSLIAMCIFKPFSVVWLHKKLGFETGLVFSTFLYFVTLMFSHIFSTITVGFSKIKEQTIVTIIGTFINIPTSIFLARNMSLGITGVILGSLISVLIGIWVGPYVTYRELKKII